MNLEVYRNYVAIIDAGTISAASRELHIAQPALSNQLKALEAAYGTQLVERGPRHITPNNAGKILYEKARRMCQLEDAAQKEINASILGTKGTLHLGITPTWPDTNSANMILDFSNTYPEIDFDIYEENSGQLLELLEKRTIEVAVIRSAGQLPPSFSVRHTIDERLMVAFHKKKSMAVFSSGCSASHGSGRCASGHFPRLLAENPGNLSECRIYATYPGRLFVPLYAAALGLQRDRRCHFRRAGTPGSAQPGYLLYSSSGAGAGNAPPVCHQQIPQPFRRC